MKNFFQTSKKLWIDFWTPSVHPTGLAIARIIVFTGACFLVNSIYLDSSLNKMQYWDPVSFYQIFSGPFLTVDSLLWLWRLCQALLILAALGGLFPISGPASALLFLLLSGYKFNFGKVHHSDQILAMSLLILAFSPAHSRLSLDNFFKKTPEKSLWKYGFPLRLIMFHVAFVMTLNGVLKLWHSGLRWIFSDNLALQLFYLPILPQTTQWLLENAPFVFTIAAGFTVLIESLSFLAFWNLYSALVFFLCWSLFHIGVHFVMGGHTDFFTQILSYSVFPLFFIYRIKEPK
jgi:hypothetical protein